MKPAGTACHLSSELKGSEMSSRRVLLVVNDVTPAARVTPVLAGEPLNAPAAQPCAADFRRIGQRLPDVVHSGKVMRQHSRAIQRGE